jgi:hypothetical protein
MEKSLQITVWSHQSYSQNPKVFTFEISKNRRRNRSENRQCKGAVFLEGLFETPILMELFLPH